MFKGLRGKVYSMSLLLLLAASSVMAQNTKATLSVQTYGYKGGMVYFDCAQTPLIRQEFYSNEGEEHVYTFDTDEPVLMVVNGRTKFLLQPGDSLHADIRYEEKQVQSVNMSGTEQAVASNRLMQGVEDIRRQMRYKSQLLSCVAVNIAPKARIDDSKVFLAKTEELLKNAKGVSEAAKAYIRAEVEGLVYVSFMEYPVMFADVRKVPIEKQEIGDYSKIMDGFKVSEDAVALSCPEYVSMLMRYSFYENEMKAKSKGGSYQMPRTFEDMYAEVAKFYKGDVRDALLYTLICNFIRGGQGIERADAIIKDYKEKYNKKASYLKVLDSLMQ